MKENNEVRSLSFYDRMQPLDAIKTLGRSIAMSQLFGCENVEQGEVLALSCFARRCDPLSLAETYHLIHGKLSMKADAQLASFRQDHGGDFEILDNTDVRVAIKLTRNGQSREFSLTWGELKAEPVPYNGKEKDIVAAIQQGNDKWLEANIKPKYATPRSRRQMMWARLVTDSLTQFAPEVAIGKYAPEVIEDFQETASAPFVASQSAAAIDDRSDVVDAEYSATSDPGETVDPPKTANPSDPATITPEQMRQIADGFGILNITADKQAAMFDRLGADRLEGLSRKAADGLIQQIARKIGAISQQVDELPQDAGPDDGRTEMQRTEPATREQLSRIRELCNDLSQQTNGNEVATTIRAVLVKSELSSLADMNYTAAESMIKALETRNLEAWAETAILAKHEAAGN